MSSINFYLKDKSTNSSTLIYLYFNYNNNRLRLSTGCSIPPKFWNEKKQRVKEHMEIIDHRIINDKLNELESIMLLIHKRHREEGFIPSPRELKMEFKNFKGNPVIEIKKKGFWGYFEEFIKYKEKELGDVRDYDKSLRKHLLKGQEITNQTLTFDALKQPFDGFITEWDEYLLYEAINANKENGLSVNTVGKLHKNLKVFLNWCFDRDYYPRFSLSHMPTLMEDVDKIYLTKDDLIKLDKVKLNKKLSPIRDLFLIGCETALRFSDFTNLSSESIKNNQIHHKPKKTNTKLISNKVVIPMSSRLKIILEKYNNKPPIFTESVASFNKQLREVCKLAKIDEIVTQNRRVKNTPKVFKYHKYELVSSHTARRTFCTLKFLQQMPTIAIMKFSGHSSERNFLKYLKMDAELVASKFENYFE